MCYLTRTTRLLTTLFEQYGLLNISAEEIIGTPLHSLFFQAEAKLEAAYFELARAQRLVRLAYDAVASS